MSETKQDDKQRDDLRRIELSQLRLLSRKYPNDFLRMAEELYQRIVRRQPVEEKT